jgi:hypothetical protein
MMNMISANAVAADAGRESFAMRNLSQSTTYMLFYFLDAQVFTLHSCQCNAFLVDEFTPNRTRYLAETLFLNVLTLV